MQNKPQGFTLIECLVALFIIALVLASSSRAIAVFIEDVHETYIREVGGWIAENEYNQYKIDRQYPDLGVASKNISMSGFDFTVSTNVLATPNPYFRKMEINVYEKSHPKYVIFHTVNFYAQY